MPVTLRPQEAAFKASLSTLPHTKVVSKLRGVLATARPLPFYAGSAALAHLTDAAAEELANRGVLVEALPLFREALADFTTLLGADHEETLLVASRLGSCLVNLGQSAEALPLVERVLARSTQLLGAKDKRTLFFLKQVASARLKLGNLAGAEALLKQGKTTMARLATAAGLSPDKPPPGLLTEWSETNGKLAQVYMAANKSDSAKLLLEESLATLAGTGSSDKTTTSVTLLSIDLAFVLHERVDLLGAEQLYREVLPKVKGTGNYGVVAQNLGMVLQQRGLVTESRKYLDIAQEAMTKGCGAESSDTQKSRLARSNLQTLLRTCAECGPVADEVVMKVCSVCNAARYCGPVCQKRHWKAHKPECKRIAAESEAVKAGRADGSHGAGPSNA